MHFDWGGSKLHKKWIDLLKSVKKERTWITLCPTFFSMKNVVYIECCVFFHASTILKEVHALRKGCKNFHTKDHSKRRSFSMGNCLNLAWNTVVIYGLVVLIAIWICWISYKNCWYYTCWFSWILGSLLKYNQPNSFVWVYLSWIN